MSAERDGQNHNVRAQGLFEGLRNDAVAQLVGEGCKAEWTSCVGNPDRDAASGELAGEGAAHFAGTNDGVSHARIEVEDLHDEVTRVV